MNQKVKLFLITGSPRSGTTILGRVVAETEQALYVGELFRSLLYKHENLLTFPCGCGAKPQICSFWKKHFPNLEAAKYEKVFFLVRLRNVFFWPILMLLYKKEIRQFNQDMIALTAGLLDDNKLMSIADTSKINLLPVFFDKNKFEIHHIHIIRNPREVARSWASNKSYLTSQPKIKVYFHWFLENLEILFLRINHPIQILRFSEVFQEKIQVSNHVHHCLAGNPSKLKLANDAVEE